MSLIGYGGTISKYTYSRAIRLMRRGILCSSPFRGENTGNIPTLAHSDLTGQHFALLVCRKIGKCTVGVKPIARIEFYTDCKGVTVETVHGAIGLGS